MDKKNLLLVGTTWYLRAMVNGAVIKKSLRTGNLDLARKRRDEYLVPIMNHKDEKQMLKSIRRQLAGIEVEEEEEKRRDDTGILIADMWGKFYNDPGRHQVKASRLGLYRLNLRRLTMWLEQHHPEVKFLRQLTKGIAREYAAKALASSRAIGTYNHVICSLHYMCKIVGEYDDYFINPFTMGTKNANGFRREPFTDDELRTIFNADDEEFVRLMGIGLYTALRLGNARSVKWDDITFNGGSWYLMAIHSKTHADGSIRVPKPLKEILGRVPKNERVGYVCPSYAELNIASASQKITKKLNDLGIATQKEVKGINGKVRTASYKSFHSLRHTAVTKTLSAGASVAAVKRLAGHSTVAMQEHYTHLDADVAGQTAEMIGKFW